MRGSVMMVVVMAGFLGGAPVAAQSAMTQVRVDVRVRMPEVLRLEQGDSHTIREADDVITRTTVYVTANRAWNLTALVSGVDDASSLRIEADARHGVQAHPEGLTASGRNGTRIPVVIEVRRPVDAQPVRLEWMLGAA